MEQTDRGVEMAGPDSDLGAPLVLRMDLDNLLSGRTGQNPLPLPGIPISSRYLVVQLLFLSHVY